MAVTLAAADGDEAAGETFGVVEPVSVADTTLPEARLDVVATKLVAGPVKAEMTLEIADKAALESFTGTGMDRSELAGELIVVVGAG